LREISARVGGDPGYPGLAGPHEVPAARKPARLALLETTGWKDATAGAKAGLEAAAGRLRAAGVELLARRDRPEIAEAETALADAMAVTRGINDWEGRWPMIAYRGRPGLSQIMIDRLAHADSMTREEYETLLAARARIRTAYARLKGVCDGSITLTAPGAAPVGLGSTGNPIFVVPGSALGVPALSLPLLADEGLPLGLQLLGYEQEDAAAFAVARWIDATLAG
jgi:Asp-tRNA(Asn)/Glu-tRNA(Gln) amidotransferase A subunit family amidase